MLLSTRFVLDLAICIAHSITCCASGSVQNGDVPFLMQATSVESYRSTFLNHSWVPPPQNGHIIDKSTTTQDITGSPKSPAVDVSSKSSTSPVIFIPGFQGTLLYDCSGRTQNTCNPLFLSPLVPYSYQHVYDSLLLPYPAVTAFSHLPYTADYPTFTCPPSPFSHIAHCNPLPAKGTVHQLINHLLQANPPVHVDVVPYDWRQSAPDLLSPSGSSAFVQAFTTALDKRSAPAVVVAHGTACRLVARFLNTMHTGSGNCSSSDTDTDKDSNPPVKAFICLAPATSQDAVDALQNGTGLLTEIAHAHAHADACANVWDSHRLDFTYIDSELGLSRRRRSAMPHVPGVWDVSGPRLVSLQSERQRLARGLRALTELAASDGVVPAVPGVRDSVCVAALSEGVRSTPAGCEVMPAASSVARDVHRYDLIGLASDVVRRFAGGSAASR